MECQNDLDIVPNFREKHFANINDKQLTPLAKTASISESGITDFSSITLESGAI